MAAYELSDHAQTILMMAPETWPVFPAVKVPVGRQPGTYTLIEDYWDTLHLGLVKLGIDKPRWLMCMDCGLLRNWVTDPAWFVQLGAGWKYTEPVAWPEGSPLLAGQLALCLWCGKGSNLSVSAVMDATPPQAISAAGTPILVYK